jgi:hypothetical protein
LQIHAGHLTAIRELLAEASLTLDSELAALREAEHRHMQAKVKLQQLQAAFDVAAQHFAQGTELTAAQIEQLPATAREILR